MCYHILISPYPLPVPKCSHMTSISPGVLYVPHVPKCPLYTIHPQISSTSPICSSVLYIPKCPQISSLPLVHGCPLSPSIFHVSHATRCPRSHVPKCPLHLPCFQMFSISSMPPNFIPHPLHPNVSCIFIVTCILLCLCPQSIPSLPSVFPVSLMCPKSPIPDITSVSTVSCTPEFPLHPQCPMLQ